MSKTTHGMSRTLTYSTWHSMKSRCNLHHERYKDYNGRGITYDPRWDQFENFFEDMGVKPPGLTLERKDNDKGYSKDNCEWATPTQQAHNKRNNNPVPGVHWNKSKRKNYRGNWLSRITVEGKKITLYSGKDFFEAVCARKSYDLRKQHEK